MDPVVVGLLGIVLLLVLFLLNMPVSFAMAFVGFVGFGYLVGWEASMSLLVSDLFSQLSNYPLNVIVLFVLMGSFAFAAGMSGRLYDSANKIAGKLPAGLAVATILACSGFAAICGSTAATAATIGRVSLPEMQRFGYSRRMATGCIASAGSIGILIPPSTIFIVYGILTEQSIGSLFAAGILPGLVLTILFVLTVFAAFGLSKDTAPSGQKYTVLDKLKALWRIADIFLLFALSIGGMFLGWYSPNQAAGVGAAGALILGMIHRELTWKKFFTAAREGLRTSCMIMMLIACASVFGKFMAVTTIPANLSIWVSELQLPNIGIMVLICIFFFIGGCFIDAMALIMLTIPIIYPVILQMNYDPIWFGVVIVLISQIAVVTPPVGINVYVVKGIAPKVPIETIFRGTFPFLVAMVVLLGGVLIFPELVLWLPRQLNP